MKTSTITKLQEFALSRLYCLNSMAPINVQLRAKKEDHDNTDLYHDLLIGYYGQYDRIVALIESQIIDCNSIIGENWIVNKEPIESYKLEWINCLKDFTTEKNRLFCRYQCKNSRVYTIRDSDGFDVGYSVDSESIRLPRIMTVAIAKSICNELTVNNPGEVFSYYKVG